MESLNVVIASQTPPAKFNASQADLRERYPEMAQPVDLRQLQEGVDYTWTTGGVPVMLRQLLASAKAARLWRGETWVALNPSAPAEYLLEGTRVRSVSLDPPQLEAYAACKEKMWAEIHQLPLPGGPITPREFAGFTAFNWRTARSLMEVVDDADVAFVHDFQLLQQGCMLGLSAPVVLRWHIPFQPDQWSPYFRNYVTRVIEDFDGVIVSCRRDLEGLLRSGYRGVARQVYPYLDLEASGRPPTSQAREEFWERNQEHVEVDDDAPVVVCVSRMDPIKGQDRLIKAMATVAQKVPDAKLVLVGNGSFTSAVGNGLGHPKGARWRQHLGALTKELGLDGKVVFTGHLSQDLVAAAWERAQVVVQPSTVEGFGLTAIEAWLHGKPVVVSRGAGASELVLDGVNGHTYDPDDPDTLASHLLALLSDPSGAERMGRRGRETAQRCALDVGVRAETGVLQEALDGFPTRAARKESASRGARGTGGTA